MLVEPVHPVQGREFELVDCLEGTIDFDALVLVETDYGLGHDSHRSRRPC